MTQMPITELIRLLKPLEVSGERSGAISGLRYDSRQVAAGDAFFALCGAGVDGHVFIDAAIAAGARVIVMNRAQQLPDGVTGLVVDDSRSALAEASCSWFGRPADSMLVIGVTGTNGKTTITWLLEAILKAAGRRPAVIGTVSYRFEDREIEASHTTPESYALQQILAEFRKAGADALVMEVSSHALEQKRVQGIRFDVGIFSNLTPEHLDYHGNMADYYLSKKRLFSEHVLPAKGIAVINSDDVYGRRLIDELPVSVSCGCDPGATVAADEVTLGAEGIAAHIRLQRGEFALRSQLLGRFNVNNLLCAVAGAEAAGIETAAIRSGVEAVSNVPGRLERVVNDRGALILVDYAHTGDALENVLKTVTALPAERVLTIFGCGGDRDTSKRPVMGEVAARYSDIAIVTSDNPRTEDAAAIIADILPGVRRHFSQELQPAQLQAGNERGYLVIADRRQAIQSAVAALRVGDLLLVAGKGHEDYQIIGHDKIHFDDREEIVSALQQGSA